MALSMIVSLYTVRVILHVLGVEDYGIYGAIGGVISSLTIFTNALSAAAQRFFSAEIGRGDNGSLNRVFNTMILLYLLAGIIVLIIAETLGIWFFNNRMVIPPERVDAAFVILQCTIVSFFISILISPFQAIIIAKEDMKIYAYVGIYDVIAKLLIVYLLQLFDQDKLILYGYLLLISSISSQFIYLLFTINKYSEIKFYFYWNLRTIKSILAFSSWTFIGCLAFLFNAQGLNLMINVFFGPIANAAYSIGNTVKNAVNQLGSNFFVAVRPSMMKEYVSNNIVYVRQLFLFSTKVIFSLLFMIMFPIMMETDGILSLWLGEVGEYMVSFVRLMLVWALLLNISDPITALVQAANKVKSYHLKVDLFTLLSLPLTYVAFKLGATPIWSFVVSVVILGLAHIIRLIILRSIIDVGIRYYFFNIILKIMLAVFISFGISYLIRNLFVSSSVIALFCKIALDAFIAIAVSYVFVLDREERMRINEMVRICMIKLCGVCASR